MTHHPTGPVLPTPYEIDAVATLWPALSESGKAAMVGRLPSAPCGVTLTEQSRSADAYGRNIRGSVRALWGGVIDLDQFLSTMQLAVRRGLTLAWREGAAECGIKPDELTEVEIKALEMAIRSESVYIFDFGEYIEANSKATGGLLRSLMNRVGLWINRYLDVTNRAKVMACKDQKLEWVINYVRGVKENCDSCLRLNGQVRRGSAWQRAGVRPQSPPNAKLACRGWKCGCGLVPTDKPVSRGKLPSLP